MIIFHRKHPKQTLTMLPLLVITLALGGCAGDPGVRPDTQSVDPGVSESKPVYIKEITRPIRPKIELTKELLYRLLVAEIAGHRGDLNIAIENYMELARETRDPAIAERAARIGVYMRDNEVALEAARIWLESDPLSIDGRQVLAAMLIRQGKVEEALTHLEYLLANAKGPKGRRFKMIANLLGREKDRETALSVMARLVDNHQDNPDALFSYAHLAMRVGDLVKARNLTEKVLRLTPDNANVAITYLRILQKQGNATKAIEWLEDRLDGSDSNKDNAIRLLYARLLVDEKRFDDARRQFEILSVAVPRNVSVHYGLGLLYLQTNKLDKAKQSFMKLIKLRKRIITASYYLGQVEESQKNYEAAMNWYLAVEKGEYYLDAQIRIAILLSHEGNTQRAREHLKSIRSRNITEASRIIRAEAEMLSEEGQFEEAMEVYNQAIEKYPDNGKLLYARAMLAEKMDRIDLLERDLKRILDKKPDDSQALNALGYTLADRTERYQEAYEYIKRALELSPQDYYILDSMGWVLYRLGEYNEAVHYLKKAADISDDPEIAAHLGEVLWVTGDEESAREVWDSALKLTPGNQGLINIIKRFQP